jgi:anti-anti-sigma factor
MRTPFLSATVVNATVVTCHESHLRGTNAALFWRELNGYAGHGAYLALDFGRVRSVDGAALGKLVAVYRTARAAGGDLTLENVGLSVHEILAITGLARLFRVVERGEAGLSS